MKNSKWLLILTVGFLFSCSSDSGSTLTVKGSALSEVAKLTAPRSQTLAGSPTSFKVTLYGLYISANEDCSDPIQIADFGTDGEEFDLMENPTLVEADVAEGEYKCLITHSSDVMKFTADDAAVAAHAGCVDTTTEYSFDIYRDGESDDNVWIDIDGNPINGTGSAAAPGNDRPFSYASTASDLSVIKASGVSVHENQSLTLASALIVPGQTTFFVDATDSLTNHDESGSDYCWVEHIVSGFR